MNLLWQQVSKTWITRFVVIHLTEHTWAKKDLISLIPPSSCWQTNVSERLPLWKFLANIHYIQQNNWRMGIRDSNNFSFQIRCRSYFSKLTRYFLLCSRLFATPVREIGTTLWSAPYLYSPYTTMPFVTVCSQQRGFEHEIIAGPLYPFILLRGTFWE